MKNTFIPINTIRANDINSKKKQSFLKIGKKNLVWD